MKKFGIGMKLTIAVVVLLFVACATLGTLSYLSSTNEVQSKIEQTLVWKAEDATKYIEEFSKRTNGEIEAIAEQSVIQGMDESAQYTYLDAKLKDSTDYLGFGIVDAAGTAHYTDGTTADLSDRSYIKLDSSI